MEISKNDINPDLARRAFSGTSFDPEKRGEQVRKDYEREMTAFYSALMIQAKNETEREYLEKEAEKYRQGYITHLNAWLSAHASCYSVMITGGSNFNNSRHQKMNDREQRKTDEFAEWREKAAAAIRKGLKQLRTAAAGGPAVILRQEIEATEKHHEILKKIRAAFRREKEKEKRMELLKEITGLQGEELAEFITRNYIDEDGPPAFRLRNNGARIRAMRDRLEALEKRGNTPTTEKVFPGGRVMDNAEADRIQIFFNEKPGPESYGKLKSRGFRWSPTAGAWQRYRTPDTRRAVDDITGVKI